MTTTKRRCVRCGKAEAVMGSGFCEGCRDIIRQSPHGRCSRCGMWTNVFVVSTTGGEQGRFTYACFGCAHPTYDPFDGGTP